MVGSALSRGEFAVIADGHVECDDLCLVVVVPQWEVGVDDPHLMVMKAHLHLCRHGDDDLGSFDNDISVKLKVEIHEDANSVRSVLRFIFGFVDVGQCVSQHSPAPHWSWAVQGDK